jgi:putative addiction module CopG family antidote
LLSGVIHHRSPVYTHNIMSATTATLSPELAQFVEEQVRAGKFATTDEAVNAAVLKAKRREEQTAWLKEQLRPAIEAADRGEFVEFTAEDIIREGRARLAAQQQR